MKPFNLEEAKKGKPICTRNGYKARLICTDLKGPDYHIVAAVMNDDCGEDTIECTDDGLHVIGQTNCYDLMMSDEEPKCPFKPFDKVLVRDRDDDTMKWQCTLFSHYADYRIKHKFACVDDFYAQCIPYNEETEHLIATTDDAPEKYVIW